jgi:hypothetical protein
VAVVGDPDAKDNMQLLMCAHNCNQFLYVSEKLLELIPMQGTTRPTGEAVFCET